MFLCDKSYDNETGWENFSLWVRLEKDGSKKKKGLRAAFPCCWAVIYDVSPSPTMWSEIRGLTETLAYSPVLTLFNSLLQQPAPWSHTLGDGAGNSREGNGQKDRLGKRDDGEAVRPGRRQTGENERWTWGVWGKKVRCWEDKGRTEGLSGMKRGIEKREGWGSGERLWGGTGG